MYASRSHSCFVLTLLSYHIISFIEGGWIAELSYQVITVALHLEDEREEKERTKNEMRGREGREDQNRPYVGFDC